MVRGISTGLALALVAGAHQADAGNRALLVGISNYPHLPAESQLRAPSGDALRMRDFLVGQGLFAADEVALLLNSEATADRIVGEIAGLSAETVPGDRVLIYFSGHGTRFDDKDGDEEDGQDEVLVAADALAPGGPGRTLPGLIPDDIMALLLARLAGREVTVILDACHSGTGTRDSNAVADPDIRAHAVEIVTRGAGREPMSPAADPPFVPATGPAGMVWAASAPAQVAWEEKGRSVFTDAFIEGLARRTADANRNGLITSAELLDFVRARAAAWCKSSRPCRESGAGFTPHFEGPPDAVLLTYRTEAPAAPVSRPPAATPPVPPRPAVVGPDARDILGATNDAGLSVRMVGGPRLRLGDEVRFVVESGRPGTLVLFDINPSGSLYQLSPSRLSRPGIGPIAAGVPVSVPEGTGPSGRPLAIRASGETGPGLVVALLVEDAGQGIEEILGRNLALKRVPDAPAVLAALAARLRAMQVEGGTNRALRWSALYLDYTIDP